MERRTEYSVDSIGGMIDILRKALEAAKKKRREEFRDEIIMEIAKRTTKEIQCN